MSSSYRQFAGIRRRPAGACLQRLDPSVSSAVAGSSSASSAVRLLLESGNSTFHRPPRELCHDWAYSRQANLSLSTHSLRIAASRNSEE
jgi:hypothetical protein